MEYTSNYNFSKPEGNDVINPNSREGYNGNFDTLDTTLKSVSDKANTNEGNITDLQGDITALQSDVTILYNLIVPVGSILCFANDTNPNNIYQGTTWQKIEGKFLLGSSNDYALGDTGGEATHTLTEQEMPTHHHESMRWNGPNGYPLSDPNSSGVTGYAGNFGGLSKVVTTGRWNTSNVGGGQAHNNMPPYEVVNYWKRIA